MTTVELVEKIQNLIRILQRDLGTKRSDAIFKKAKLRPIELKMLLNFKFSLTDDDRKFYESHLTKLEEN